MTRKRVLFICSHNAARSQMAEGYLRASHGDRFEAFSAGTKASTLSPYAIQVMQEIGVDISRHRSKSLHEFASREMDVAIIVCDAAKSACPFFPWAKVTLHAIFRNPKEFAGTDDEIINGFREIRDEITGWIDRFVSEK